MFRIEVGNDIVALGEIKEISTGTSFQRVIAKTTDQDVVATPAIDRVITLAAID